MQERILQLLAAENLSQTEFAQRIGVSGSNVTHIINGRNNPSYEFILRVASHFPAVNLDWLLLGKGKMYRDTPLPNPQISAGEGLFDEHIYDNEENIALSEGLTPPSREDKATENQRKAARITIFYDDGSFQDLEAL
ncbi:MAG: helix-turn-helix transcriptional regulator [Bacteroidales bacterium]|nr:helix-turn-helix transcriptional regulator [Bacteroidales bacterium]